VALLGGGKSVMSTEVTVMPGSPAEAAGMRTGDRVRSVAGQPVGDWEELKKGIGEHAGAPVEVVVERGGEESRHTVTPEGPPGEGRIGVAAGGTPRRVPVGFGEALGRGLASPVGVIRDIVKGVGAVVTGNVSGELSGPVGIVRAASNAPTPGWSNVVTMVAVLISYTWPLAVLLAAAMVPRRARARAGLR